MQINKKYMRKTKDIRVTVTVYANGVSGEMLEVENWEGISINEATFRIKEAFANYDSPYVKMR